MIYLDNAATTDVYPEVVEAMLPYLHKSFGNAGSVHSMGREARNAIESARESVASLIGARQDQIIFTSGGTEANNLAVHTGAAYARAHNLNSCVVTTRQEHKSILRSATREFQRVLYAERNPYNILQFPKEIDGSVGFATVMHTNNETGIENNLRAIAEECTRRGILFHTDCVQAAGYSELDVCQIGCDMLSLSSHKIHGSKGVGALFVTDVDLVNPLVVGGSNQEFGKRAGTENVAGIVGFGTACEIAKRYRCEHVNHINRLRQRFIAELMEACGRYDGLKSAIHINSCSGKVVNFRIDGVDGETLLVALDSKGVCASSGSACNSEESVPSHVLLSLGLTEEQARSSIRVSFSVSNTMDDVVAGASIIMETANDLLNLRM